MIHSMDRALLVEVIPPRYGPKNVLCPRSTRRGGELRMRLRAVGSEILIAITSFASGAARYRLPRLCEAAAGEKERVPRHRRAGSAVPAGTDAPLPQRSPAAARSQFAQEKGT